MYKCLPFLEIFIFQYAFLNLIIHRKLVPDYFVLKAPALFRKNTCDMQISTTNTPFSTTRHTNSVAELNVSKPC